MNYRKLFPDVTSNFIWKCEIALFTLPQLLWKMQIANARSSMKHAEVVIARQAVEEGRGLVVIVNKMDLLRKKHKSIMQEVMQVVPNEIQTVIPQV